MIFSTIGNATRPIIAPRPFVISASARNGPNASGASSKPFGDDFLSAGAKEDAKVKITQAGTRKNPAAGYVDVRVMPSASVNVRSLNNWCMKLVFDVSST